MEVHKLNNIEYIQNFILGGKADFIISDIEKRSYITGTHINYIVNQDKKDETLFYIRYNSNTKIVIGTIRIKTQGDFNIPTFTIKKHLQPEFIFKAELFRKLILYIFYINRLPDNIDFLYTGICSVCGRKLTDPTYIEIGIGPTCLKNSNI